MLDLKDIIESIDGHFHPSSSKLKKHFTEMIKKDINSGFIKENNSNYIELTKNVIDVYYKNKNLLKQYLKEDASQHFDVMKKNTSNLPWHEYLMDNIVRLKTYSDNKKYAKSFVRSYKDLLNDDIIKGFGVLKEKEIDRDIIEEKLSKVAAYTSEDLETAVKKIILENSLSPEFLRLKIEEEELNAEIIEDSENSMVILIHDYEAAQELGSTQWCISYNDSNYEEYLTGVSDKYDSVYEKYNDSDEESKYTPVVDDPEDAGIQGNHIFVWDWSKDESDPMSKFAFSVNSAGDIVAAHDKEDEDILENFDNRTIYSEACTEVAKNTFDIFMEKIAVEDYNDWNNLYALPFNIIANVSYPLAFYKEIAKKVDIRKHDIFDEGILLPKELLEKTLEDHKLFGFRKEESLVDDILWFANFVEKFQEFEPDYDAVEDDGGFYSMEELGIYNYHCSFTNKMEVIHESKVLKMINNLNDTTKFVAIKTMENNDIISDLNSYLYNGISDKDILEKLQGTRVSFENYTFNKENKVDTAIFFEKNHKMLTLSEPKRIFSSLYCLNNGCELTSENMTLIKEKLIDGTIHPNNIVKNITKIKEEYVSELTNTLNGIDFKEIKFELDALSVMRLAKSSPFLEEINENLANAIRKNLGEDKSTFGLFGSFEPGRKVVFENYDFGDKMKSLSEKGIINKEIFEDNFNDGELCFGDKDSYPKDQFKSIKDYIFSGDCAHTKKKKQMKLGF